MRWCEIIYYCVTEVTLQVLLLSFYLLTPSLTLTKLLAWHCCLAVGVLKLGSIKRRRRRRNMGKGGGEEGVEEEQGGEEREEEWGEGGRRSHVVRCPGCLRCGLTKRHSMFHPFCCHLPLTL